MNARLTTPLRTIFSSAASASTGLVLSVEDFKHIIFQLATDGGADAALTVKFQGSVSDEAPIFSAAKSATNHWDYIQVIDLDTGDPIDGATGFSVATADAYKNLEANINGLKWVCATITARTQGELTLKAKAYNNY